MTWRLAGFFLTRKTGSALGACAVARFGRPSQTNHVASNLPLPRLCQIDTESTVSLHAHIRRCRASAEGYVYLGPHNHVFSCSENTAPRSQISNVCQLEPAGVSSRGLTARDESGLPAFPT